MSINIIVDNIPFNTAHNRRPYLNLKPTSITIHSTANASSTAKGERAWLTNPSNTRQASWHYLYRRKAVLMLFLHITWRGTLGMVQALRVVT
jgi:N-acetylmuramoyl-L-alanine amidase